MTRNTRKRIVLYSTGLLLFAGLAYAGFVYEADPELAQFVGSAEVCANYGRPDDGIRWAEQGLRIDPDHRYLHIILAKCYERKGEFDRAADYYARAAELTSPEDPGRDLLALHRAEMLESGKRGDEAIRAVEAVIERSPGHVAARYVLGRFYLARNDLEAARTVYSAAADLAPDDFEPLALLASVAEKQGKSEKSLQLLLEAERRVAPLGEAAAAELRTIEPNPDNLVRRSELSTLLRKHASIELSLARHYAASGSEQATEERLVAAAGLSPRLTRRTLRTEEILAPYRESERLRAVLTGMTPANGEKN